ncbi:hypothetical protein [Paenibacillus sp. R14(2021)]|uniref:hypothetical protein n=1 Tax=Paenibacillus sp. R14(2021) TaxID=2859228 RepID=UPI001C6137F7|nr:hypothetical protein [Paenibacillus sp. R14(2021)]
MIHSLIDSDIWNEELGLMEDQAHFEEVWSSIEPELKQTIAAYLDKIVQGSPSLKPEASMSLYIQKLVNEHARNRDKYVEIFEPDVMVEYQEDVDGFKGSVLSRQCVVIQRTLNSSSEALKDWKIAYKLAAPQKLYDTFYNLIFYAEEYNDKMSEEVLQGVDSIEATEFSQLAEDACYLPGVVGTGILSTVLNTLHPRLFPGQFKMGMFSLFILSGKKPIAMKSGSSEFLMVKDDIRSKTGTIEQEHNYYYPYQTFGLYSLRIYCSLEKEISDRFHAKFPDDFRYVLTNDFYDFICEVNKQTIQTLLGNDDQLKFKYSI